MALAIVSDRKQATRTLIARKLKGLEDIVTFSSVHWHLGQNGMCCGEKK